MEHSGIESYANNPGHVDEASGPRPEKDEHAPDPSVKRQPVVPQRGRPAGVPPCPGNGE